ncbi:alpha/beta fold hydrolase [Streptomyces sp. VRA16 Mangrove soil]|uniref:alpha/beta fold hydrolase n=1 Tax=Streptomyces sp. VRA16 Mangrove soil TaxID=2817434 RepID=UPI001A9D8D1B|nr:alpha/beta hydrolase [Streptomyces sp. VRA16 Mangrove soil]MBO1335548.1 alpha/beta hydrolase [Streptomyces sp. VRA16 Mangrove soil]
MKLHTREWGSGDRVALLVHGIMSDHRTWRRVGPALAARGYRVIGVDLRGHGESGRGGYSAEGFADDLVETLPTGAELAVGHSLGGMALALAVERLAPRRAVYSDPAWALGSTPVDPALFMEFRGASRQMIANLNPRWEEADIDVELATLAAWDPRTALAVAGEHAVDRTPERAVVPSLVQAADPSFLVSDALKEELVRRGFEVRTVAGAGHTVHRDDFDGFMKSLEGWL